MQTEAEIFYRDHGHQPVTPEQLEAVGAKRNANGIYRFNDGSYGEIVAPREVRAAGYIYPVGTIFFDIVEPSDSRVNE